MARAEMVSSVTTAPVVTAARMVEGHVALDVSCLDRIYLNGYCPGLQTPGGVIYFLHTVRGKQIASPAVMEQIGNRFRAEIKDWAAANQIPVITFTADQRKVEVMRPLLDQAAAVGRSRVVAIGRAQEYQQVWSATKRETDPAKSPQFSYTRQQRRVSVFYLYIWDEEFGDGFIKICTYFPYPIKVWLNGHEWAKRQAAKAGLAFTSLSNGFASCPGPAALQTICDRLGPEHIQAWFERWTAAIPLRPTGADRGAGFWWELSMRQIETSRTLVSDTDCHARAFFEALPADNMDPGRPHNVELLFRRGQTRGAHATTPPRAGFRTATDRYRDLVTLNVFYEHSRLKQYLKDGRALRIEPVVNNPTDLRCNRRLANLPELREKARAINDLLLETETVGQGTVLVSPVIERITKPTVTDEGRKAPALRFGDLRVQALAGALANLLTTATGITNRHLRVLMTGLLGRPYTANQASYDLARLRANQLIDRIPDRNTYTLGRDGLAFAHIYTKVYDHVLRPLMAPDSPNAPPELATALQTIEHVVAERIAAARGPTTARPPPAAHTGGRASPCPPTRECGHAL